MLTLDIGVDAGPMSQSVLTVHGCSAEILMVAHIESLGKRDKPTQSGHEGTPLASYSRLLLGRITGLVGLRAVLPEKDE